MIKFISLLLLLSVQAFAGNGSGNVSNTTLIGGGGPLTAGSTGVTCTVTSVGASGGCQVLICGVGASYTAGNYLGCYKNGTQYQVPGGKKFYVAGFAMFLAGATTQDSFIFGYATATFTNNTGSTPTGAVDYGSRVNSADDTVMFFPHTSATWEYFPMGGISFPASDYPYVRTWASTANGFYVHFYGVEQ